MWIPARFLDTLKRHERIGAPRLLAVLGLFALAGTAGCVVTDKIEFEDAVNHPISIERESPESSIITVNRSNVKTFSAIVWDKDVTDPEGGEIDGRLEIRADYWTDPVLEDCEPPGLMEPADTDGDPTPDFRIQCSINLATIENVMNDSLLEVRLIVSDLGFYHNQVKDGAQTAEILWVLQVQQDVE